tara:strand:+ start:927 stop:1973 length:1047 start_codon:yes stop_codon:yes gene_type:complete
MLISHAKAAILVAQKKPLIVDEIKLPNCLEVGQILVKIDVSGICGSQLGEIDGVKGKDEYLPHLMGHEGSGTILEIGPGVSTKKPGDRVILHWRKGAGIQSQVPKYKWHDKELNAGNITTFNSHAIISENRCTPINHDITNEEASLFGCAITTGFGVIENNAKAKMGESVVVMGAGGIGLNIIQAANLMSCWPIIAVDLVDSRLHLSKKMGATHTINSRGSDPEKLIREILNKQELDIFIDNTGLPSLIEMGYRLTHSEGRVVLVGVPSKGANISIYSLPLHFGKVITGSHGGECNPDKDIPRYIKLLKEGKYKLKDLITSRFKLENINEAIACMREGKTAGRVLIDM